MRILVANKFWYRRGGLERVMFDEIAWLEQAGHEIAHFSTTHPQNDCSPWSNHFVPYLELGESTSLSARQKVSAAIRFFHNREAAGRFSRLLVDFRPDVIHIHGIHRQISPSILAVARQAGLPVVQSLHDYHQICPSDNLLHAGREVCDPRRCGNLWFGPCVAGRCVRDNLAASALSAAETAWAHARRVYGRSISRFISPSHFLRDQMQAAGCTAPIDVIPNAVPVGPPREGPGSGFVIIGRLAREKGLEVALAAAEQAGVDLTVAGDGPLRRQLQAAYGEVTFTGHLGGEQVDELVRGARAVVVPSLWFENAPMSVLEPMSAGVPVIASRIGGIPEQVTDGESGVLVTPGNAEELAAAMLRLDNDPILAHKLGTEAVRVMEERFSPETHLTALLRTYEACLSTR